MRGATQKYTVHRVVIDPSITNRIIAIDIDHKIIIIIMLD